MNPNETQDRIKISLSDIVVTASGLLALAVLLFSYTGGFFMNNTACILVSIVTIVITLIYSLKDISTRYVLFGFNITYYLFLISGMATHLFDEKRITEYLLFSANAANHATHCIAISIIVVDVAAYLIMKHRGHLIKIDAEKPQLEINKNVRIIILLLFVAVLFFKLATAVIRYRYTQQVGYSTIYQYNVSMPALIRIPATFFYILLCLWLTTKPRKAEFVILTLFVIVIEAIIFFSGDRGEAMSALLVIAFYILKRQKSDEDFIHFKKRHVIILVILIPLMIYLVQYVQYSRRHNEMSSESVYTDFFDSQGISATIVSGGYDLKNSIGNIGGYTYVTGTLRSYILHNAFTRAVFGTSSAAANTATVALSGESYGSTMAYVRFRDSYLNEGIGCGTSYIAELWHDGGIVFVIFGSIVLAYLLYLVTKKSSGNFGLFSGAIFTLMTIYLIQIPRGNCFAWLTSTLSINNIILFAVVALLYNYYNSNRKKAL